MKKRSWEVQSLIDILKYYRGFLLGTYIVGAVVVLYCLMV